MQTHPEPVFLADDGTYVDVTDFVRFELHHKDIRYGVLDLIVISSIGGGGRSAIYCIFSSGRSQRKRKYPFPRMDGRV